MGIFAGVDWGSATHAVCVINSSGESLAHFEVKHDEGGLSSLLCSCSTASRKSLVGRNVLVAPSGRNGLILRKLSTRQSCAS
jgi:Transposase